MIDTSLPIAEVLPGLRARLEAHPAVVLQAAPGAGKTTIVPLALLDAAWLAGRSIVMLEPRRLAARAAAARMAELLGEEVGGTVGYRVRLDTRVSRRTRIEVVTEGILTRRLQGDPALDGVGLVIFDEFHERHLHADLALALCLDARSGLREDLKILVMSATLDVAGVSALLDDAPIVTSEGRSYPVEIRHAAPDAGGDLANTVAQAVRNALERDPGDVLAFLPGAGEIRRAEELLAAMLPAGVQLHPLYGDLAKEAQDRAIRPDPRGRRKVVLATPIAETSLTIEGIGVVVDAGYRRTPRFDPRSGLTRLETVRIAKDAAEQRAGRAGRLGPGVCYRLWSEATQRGLVPRTAPEILNADLAELALELAAWGVGDAAGLAWLDPPPAPALAQARSLLQALGALDARGRITEAGRQMAALPVHPRLARMLVASKPLGLAALACDLAALVSERDVLAGRGADRSADIMRRVEALIAMRANDRRALAALGADARACGQVERSSRQLRAMLDVPAETAPQASQAGLLLAHAYPDRVALQRAPDSGRYLLASGRGARLDDPGFRGARLIVAASLDAGQAEGRIFLAAPLDEVDLRTRFAGRIQVRDSVRWDAQREAVVAQREERFGEVVLGARQPEQADRAVVAAALIEGIRSLGVDRLPWTAAARQWQARVLSLRGWLPEEEWSDVSDPALSASLETWLAPHLAGMSSRADLQRLDLHAILESRLDWQQRRRLEEGAPTHLTVPSGSRIALDYRPGESPVLAVKLQELFGLADTPRIAFGRVPVTLHLLSPARRPIQVTQDLRGFWERTYADVKKELKGRYPKHPWPDDPWKALPTARAKPR